MPPVLIQGGGVIGLSIGWQLARSGARVTLVDRAVGPSASWVAAGLLTPYSDEENPLAERGFACYPRFLQELAEDSGTSIAFEGQGTLLVARDRRDLAWLDAIYQRSPSVAQRLSGEEARLLEPLLSPRIPRALLFPTERHINNRALLDALQRAFMRCGGGFAADEPPAECIVEAKGAWSSGTRPVKGQILTLRAAGPRYILRSREVYLAAKADGILRVGATSEERGFDETVTAGGVLDLLREAWEICPAIAEAELVEALAAFRPTRCNGQLEIGKTAPNHFSASGHGRAGILLAPLTAYKLREEILCR